MKNFLIVMFVFSATIAFAQNNKQVEPVKQSIESEDIKKEMKETPDSKIIEPDVELDQLDDMVDEELELLKEETNEMEMKEEEVEEVKKEKKEKMKEKKEKKEKVKEKIKLQPNDDLKSDEE